MKFHPSAPRKLKDGSIRYYIRYWNGDKHETVDRTLYTPFKSKKEAWNWINNDKAMAEIYKKLERDTTGKVPLAKLEKSKKSAGWKRRFFEHNDDFTSYINYMKKPGRAPNSWQATEVYLEKYVFHYFLNEQNEGNYVGWHRLFPSFIKWLEEEAISEKTGKPLSYSTRNACIKTLNGFLRYISFDKNSNREPLLLVRCPSFANELTKQNQRTYKDVIQPEELKKLKQALEVNGALQTKDFLTVLYHTGMRFNELYSMTLDSVIEKPEKLPAFMTETHKRIGEKIYGYLVLKSQSLNKTRERSRQKDGSLKRKPLKSKKIISPRNNRLIPIWDKEAWDIILKQRVISTGKCLKKEYGASNKENYYLFDGIDSNKLRADFRKVSKKSFHSTRHTYITMTAGHLLSKGIPHEVIVRSITGITSKVLEGYTHIYEELMLSAAGDDDDLAVSN